MSRLCSGKKLASYVTIQLAPFSISELNGAFPEPFTVVEESFRSETIIRPGYLTLTLGAARENHTRPLHGMDKADNERLVGKDGVRFKKEGKLEMIRKIAKLVAVEVKNSTTHERGLWRLL